MILIIDNYDSFTYNLVQMLGALGAELQVYRNDAISAGTALALKPEGIIISPGPGSPENDAGVTNELLRQGAGKVPILGVCLGHQCIGHVFGARVARAQRLIHGKSTKVYHHKDFLYRHLSNPFEAGRYHSLIVEEDGLPEDLEITAYTSEGEIMGLKHKRYAIEGVQFHPESVLTPEGNQFLKNVLDWFRSVPSPYRRELE